MSGKKRYRSTKKRIRAIVAIVNEEYQPGDQNRCYKAIWRRRILPEFGMCYHTLLSYLGVSPSELEEDQPKKKIQTNFHYSTYEKINHHQRPSGNAVKGIAQGEVH